MTTLSRISRRLVILTFSCTLWAMFVYFDAAGASDVSAVPQRNSIVARHGDLAPALRIKPVKLDDATRAALSMFPETDVEAHFERGGRTLIFSIGSSSRSKKSDALRFSIEIRDGEGWRPLFRVVLDSGDASNYNAGLDAELDRVVRQAQRGNTLLQQSVTREEGSKRDLRLSGI